MKKLIIVLLACMLVLAACSNKSEKKNNDSSKETKEYKLESGKTIKVPKKPKKIAVLTAFYVGDFIELGVKPIAVSDWTKDSSILKPHLDGVELIGDGNVEQVAKQKPDLIIVDAMDKNIKKYEKIAPTVPYTYTKYKHKDILKELGKLTGKEDKAKSWIEKWDKQVAKDKKEIQSKVGDSTASVFEPDAKEIFIYDSNWGRGLDIVHDAFGMPMNKKYKDKVEKGGQGYESISKEEIGDFAGDYIFLSKPSYGDFDFEKTTTWKNLDAVKNDKVITYKAEDYWFTDPLTLDQLREKLKKEIIKKAK
ncbi:ABC transporter substrate-binding protein [Mammaliicoccus lentus]|uniref:ABC transporter substrate-binding protein n=1 Tax=Mammaliicoccus lentus TaxID=42858 RepID=UPI001B320E88|nr:ABC transporter substrate-binding protein [Mammaliicoccus lentus]